MSKKGVDQGLSERSLHRLARCPTCGSDDPTKRVQAKPDGAAFYRDGRITDRCPDPWHNPDSPPPETPGQREQEVVERLLAAEREARDRYIEGDHEARGEMMAAHAARMEARLEQEKARARKAESQLARVREWAEKARTWASGSASDYDAGIGAAAREVLALLNTEESK